jgi:tetratricopeptide (TPR) repeat protein
MTSCEPARPGFGSASWLLVWLLWMLSAPAAAQEPAPPPTYEIYMNAARKLYAAEQYREAVEQFEKAYAAHPDPKIYFNLAQSYRKLDEPQKALSHYEKFLEAIPGIAEFSERQKRDFTQEVQARIEELRAILQPASAHPPTEGRPPAGPSSPGTPPGVVSNWWFWTGIGATALFTAGTIVAGLRTVALNDEWEAYRKVDDHDRAVRWQNATDLLLLGALFSGAAVTAAALLWEPRRPASEGTPRVGVAPGPGGGFALTLGWRF